MRERRGRYASIGVVSILCGLIEERDGCVFDSGEQVDESFDLVGVERLVDDGIDDCVEARDEIVDDWDCCRVCVSEVVVFIVSRP